MTVLGRARTAELLAAHGLTARRSLGQNFVVDASVIDRIVALAGVGPGDHVVEIGPGLGSLTTALAASGADVLGIEKDPALAGVLNEVLAEGAAAQNPAAQSPAAQSPAAQSPAAQSPAAGDAAAEDVVEPSAVRIIVDDALRLDWGTVLAGATRWVLVANLPYNVAVPILTSVLEHAPMVERLLIMVQEEVGERLVADPGGRTIGIPSVTTAWYADARIVATVGPDAFLPRPRVTSVVVELTRRPPPRDDVEPDRVVALAAAAYRQRRKMMRSSLSGRVSTAQFELAGIDPSRRPEELAVGEWATLAAVVDATARP